MSILNCAGSNNQNDTPDSIVFDLEINDEFYGIVKATADEDIDCSATGISSITAYVYADDGSLLADGGPWECESHSGEITGSMAGENRTLIIQAVGENGTVLYQGELSEITINSGENDLGNVSLNHITALLTETGTITETEEKVYYNISVAEGEKLFITLNIAIRYHEFHLYVKYGRIPTLDDYDARSITGEDEAIEISTTQAGTYYIMVYAYDFFDFGSGDFTITASSAVSQLELGISYEDTIIHYGEKVYYQTTVTGGEPLIVNLNIPSSFQDYHLYVKYGGIPTLDDYDARSITGRDEAIEISTTQAGTYYIMVYSKVFLDSQNNDYTIMASSAVNQLELGISYEDTITHYGEKVYYQTTVASGEAFIVNLNLSSSFLNINLYIKYGRIPTLNDYDASSTTAGDKVIEISTTQAGTYYILVYSSYSSNYYRSDYTITASN